MSKFALIDAAKTALTAKLFNVNELCSVRTAPDNIVAVLVSGSSDAATIGGNVVTQQSSGTAQYKSISVDCLKTASPELYAVSKNAILNEAGRIYGPAYVSKSVDTTVSDMISMPSEADIQTSMTNTMQARLVSTGGQSLVVFEGNQINQVIDEYTTSLLKSMGLIAAVDSLTQKLDAETSSRLEESTFGQDIRSLWFKFKFFIIGSLVLVLVSLLLYAYLYFKL